MTDEIVSVRLTWPVICGLACRAFLLGVSFNDVCELAVHQELKRKKEHDGS